MTLTSREGQRVPEVSFPVRVDDHWETLTTAQLFAGKTVVVFSLPGAFTPTCSSTHVPRYNQLQPLFKERGVDSIVCVSVNDTFVMNEWKKDQEADNLVFVPDGNGDFTKGMGMLVDKRDLGFGQRSWRYSMLVKDGVIEKMFIEPQVEGDPFEVSDADTMLSYIDEAATPPPEILLFTKPGCSHCTRAKNALTEDGLDFVTIDSDLRQRLAVAGSGTTPQVFVDGTHIGGADELVAWLAAR